MLRHCKLKGMRKSAPSQAGQALLIILLVMAVVLTIALAVASRSVTDISVSQKEEEASRAFSAAEAGVEQALIGGSLTGSLPAGGSFTASVSGLSQGSKSYIVPLLINGGETIPVWFVSHLDDGSLGCNEDNPCFTGRTIRVCWGEEGTDSSASTAPALELSVLYTTSPGDYKTSRIGRGAYDPNSLRRAANSFSGQDGSCTVDGQNFAFSKTINLNSDLGIPSSATDNENGLQQARLRLLYNTDRAHPAALFVDFPGNRVLPRQGTRVESVGEAGEATRKIEVYQLFPDLPPIFDFGVFSGSGGLTK